MMAALVAAWRFLLVSPATAPPPPAPTPQERVHAARAAAEWKAALQPAPVPRAPRRLVMTQADLNTLLQTEPPAKLRALVRRPHVAITPSSITLSGYVLWKGSYIPATLVGRPVREDGWLGFHVLSIRAAGFPAPPALVARVQNQVDLLLAQNAGRLDRIRSIRLGDQAIVVVTDASPAASPLSKRP